MSTTPATKASFSIPSVIAVIAAFCSFKFGAFFGLVWAGIAIVMGVLGILLALRPSTRGGIFSMIGIFGGALGVIAAVVKAILWLLNA